MLNMYVHQFDWKLNQIQNREQSLNNGQRCKFNLYIAFSAWHVTHSMYTRKMQKRLIPKLLNVIAEACKAAHTASVWWAKQIWGTTWLGNTRNSTWILQQYRQISSYTRIMRSTDWFFYAANTDIWEYKLCHSWVATRPTISPTTNVFLP